MYQRIFAWDIVVNTNKIPKKDETASGSKVKLLLGKLIKLCHQIDMDPCICGRIGKDNFGKKYLKR